MEVVITKILSSNKNVNTGEQFMIAVSVKESIPEPNMYRLPFVLGVNKGGIKNG